MSNPKLRREDHAHSLRHCRWATDSGSRLLLAPQHHQSGDHLRLWSQFALNDVQGGHRFGEGVFRVAERVAALLHSRGDDHPGSGTLQLSTSGVLMRTQRESLAGRARLQLRLSKFRRARDIVGVHCNYGSCPLRRFAACAVEARRPWPGAERLQLRLFKKRCARDPRGLREICCRMVPVAILAQAPAF